MILLPERCNLLSNFNTYFIISILVTTLKMIFLEIVSIIKLDFSNDA